MANNETTFDNFFDLPLEIRDQIISYLCLIPNPIQIGPTVDTEIPFPHHLLLSHPLIYTAGSAIFYGQNRFILNLGSGPRATIERSICNGTPWLLNNPGARRRVRYLELSPGRLGTVFQSHISPAVADMILNGSLRHLKLVLYGTSTDKINLVHDTDNPVNSQLRRAPMTRRDDTFTQSEPFKALLRLLADPDLETAELYVDPIHRTFWCEFHEGVACCQPGHPKGPWQLISIDWRKIASSYGQDHEMSIVRVAS